MTRSISSNAAFLLAAIVLAAGLSLFEYGELRFIKTASSLYMVRSFFYALLYGAVHAASIMALMIIWSLNGPIITAVVLAATVLSLFAQHLTMSLFSESLSVDHVKTAVEAAVSTSFFLSFYAKEILESLAKAIVVAIACVYVSRRVTPRMTAYARVLPVLALACVCGLVYRTAGVVGPFPSPMRVPAIVGISAFYAPLYSGDRRDVASDLTPIPENAAKLIVMVVDESITAEYLSINGYKLSTTPFLEAIAGTYVNLGRAVSAGNHSALTNIILQSGLRGDQIPDGQQAALREPNIFQYARKAGYQTIYIDGQAAPSMFVNYMRKADLKTVDEFVRVTEYASGGLVYERDLAILEIIREARKKHEKLFIYVMKNGAHFPYELQYPQDRKIITDPAPGSNVAHQAMKIDYANALRWSVDDWLAKLVPEIDPSRSVIFYTSDHGQSIERGGEGTGTHGKVVDPPLSQVSVPMLAFGSMVEEKLRPVVEAMHNKTSHFQLFSSLLVMMGYPEAQTIARHGPPLWKDVEVPRLFISGDLFARGRAFRNMAD